MTSNMFAAIRHRLRDFQKPFLETLEGRKISYGEVVSESAKFAHALKALGVKPGDRVTVQLDKSPEAIFLYLACLRAGAIFVPLNTAYTSRELDYFIGDSDPALVVCRAQSAEVVKQLCKDLKVNACEILDEKLAGSLLEIAALQ